LNGTGKKSEIAVFHISGKYYAISNRCKHVEGPLSEGELKDGIITCPWFETRVVNGKLYVNPIPISVGKRVTVPHASYLNLKNSVNRHSAK
jgi:hypothetical protein